MIRLLWVLALVWPWPVLADPPIDDVRAEVRAERRYLELVGKGTEIDRETVLADVKERDARDMERAEAPLKPAEDAVLIDTSDLAIEEAIAAAVAAIDKLRPAE